MALGLGSARLNVTGNGTPPPPVQQIKPARPSIAEDAIFIPKPHKRVEFKLNVFGGTGEISQSQAGAKPATKPIPLPGQASDNGGGDLKPIGAQDAKVTVTGENITAGILGPHGLTAEFGKDSYMAPRELVKTEYKAVPQKDFTAIATQEEGRQTNHAKQAHYTQQYDAYGRPRIGFSREPYDFAATKYVSKTSEIKFQQNMASTRETYKKYTDTNAAPGAPERQAAETTDAEKKLAEQLPVQPGLIDPEEAKGTKGLIDPKESAKKFVGADKMPQPGMIAYNPKEADTLGDGAKMKEGMLDPSTAGVAGKKNAPDPKEMMLKGESALSVAKKMGMPVDAIMTPAAVGNDNGGAYAAAGAGPAENNCSRAGSDAAASMGLDISAVLAAKPEKVADFHAANQLLKSNAAISISA